MKIIKLDPVTSKVNRKLISTFGNSVYSCENVRTVFMKVNFKDGSAISFRRDEDEDRFQKALEELEEKEKE
jgi:hypothetical protein